MYRGPRVSAHCHCVFLLLIYNEILLQIFLLYFTKLLMEFLKSYLSEMSLYKKIKRIAVL